MKNWISKKCFDAVHSRNLVYNTCWEDPKLDREALNLSQDDTVAVITSAGCNALDYLITDVKEVHSIDVNPRQNALLELKIAGFKKLSYEDFFSLFGKGNSIYYNEIYHDLLRKELPDYARSYWDENIFFFAGKGWRDSFYFRGTTGWFARIINEYIDRISKVRDPIDLLLSITCPNEQKDLYDLEVGPRFWRPMIRWMVSRDITLALLGVPRAQRLQVENEYPGGLGGFVKEKLERVFRDLPMHNNYFWRVYLTGQYEKDCCPEYLKETNFRFLRSRIERLKTHTCPMHEFLENHESEISRFVLLDHMDWLSFSLKHILEREWQAIINKASSRARIIWRSGGLSLRFLENVKVSVKNESVKLVDYLNFDNALASKLHAQDRVGTYGSFYIAEVPA